jgi:hypothetical protein
MLRRAVIMWAGIATAMANSGNGKSMAKRAQINGNDEETREENEGARDILVAPALDIY